MERSIALMSVIAFLVLAVFGCNENDSTKKKAKSLNVNAVVITTDYSSGGLAALNIPNVILSNTDISVSIDQRGDIVNSDASAEIYDDSLYVVNRYGGDNLTILDIANDFAVDRQYSTDPNSNPHDVVVLSDTEAWITRYALDSLLVINPKTGQRQEVTLNESMFTLSPSDAQDTDGIPEMDGICAVGDEVFVGVQRLDRNNMFMPPVGRSFLAVFDAETKSLSETLTLSFSNPYVGPVYEESLGQILVACVGHFGVEDGGIVAVTPGASELSCTVILTEADVGGDLSGFVILSDTHGYVACGNFTDTRIYRFNPSTGEVAASPVITQGPWTYGGMAIVDGKLLVGDRTYGSEGVRVFNTADDTELTTHPVSVGLPPNFILSR